MNEKRNKLTFMRNFIRQNETKSHFCYILNLLNLSVLFVVTFSNFVASIKNKNEPSMK